MIWDDELKQDLECISSELARRKKSRQPYAFWNMQEQLRAIERFCSREAEHKKETDGEISHTIRSE